jgi:hypothetical protein
MAFSRFLSRFAAGTGCVLAVSLLAGCVNEYALDDLRDTKPVGPPFSMALFSNYSNLARSFGSVGAAAGVAFDHGGSLELTEMDSNIGALANAYASKAIVAARGSNVEPEPGIDVVTHKMRDRLIRVIERSKETFPVDAARAQADYDCWMMNNTIDALRASANKCRASLEISMTRLEGEAKAAPVAPPAAPPPDNSDKPAVQP